MTTFEILDKKYNLAKETFLSAGVSNYVKLVKGDARELLQNTTKVSFCFLDAAKEAYGECYDLIIPKLVPGGISVADNVISHKKHLYAFVEKARNDPRVDSLVVPIGTGILFCKKL
jgi:caffeoyl-CoA O-methyltransferase